MLQAYLADPPVLRPPTPGKPLVLYLAREEASIWAMLVQEQEDKIEHAIYYLSKKLLDYEVKYSLVAKICTAMVWLTKKLRHYFQSYKIQAVAKVDPMKYLCQSPTLAGKLSRWCELGISASLVAKR